MEVVKRRTHIYLLFLVILIDPHKDNLLHRICHTCVTAKAAAHDGSKARAGKRKAEDTRGRLLGKCEAAVPRRSFVVRRLPREFCGVVKWPGRVQ